MRSTFILLLFIWCSMPCFSGNNIDSLLTELDKTLNQRDTYIKEKELRISSLKESLDMPSVSQEQIYSINTRLYEEYTKYICDSALYYIDQNLKICRLLRNKEWEIDTKLNLSYLLSTIGLGKESLDNMRTINSQTVAAYQKGRYYQSYQQAYECLAVYANDNKYAPGYYRMARIYKDSAYQFMDTTNYDYQVEYANRLLGKSKREEAKEYVFNCLSKYKSGSKEYAVLANLLASIYGGDGDLENRKKYLILSALSDIRGAILENSSLRELAILLYENDEIDKAYEYMKYSLDDANFYNARLRSIQISKIQPIINRAYQLKNIKQRKALQLYLLFISILSVFLFIAVIYIYRQIKKLSRARKELHEVNIKLKELNQNLSLANEQQKELNYDLQNANSRLADLNRELCEANHIKEEYIGHFLDLCSTYIDKLEDYRKLVNRKVSSGQIDDLFKLSKSSRIIDAELKEFYMNFDTTFLKLYPNFVQEFNALLAEGEQFTIRKGDLLNTELRIFALIRLGINDSSKIANFLRYSAQTIYNYRTKVKNKAAGSREEFEENVMKIGAFGA